MNDIIRFRHNVMQVNSLAAFSGIKGGVNQSCKDVYFVRLAGVNASLVSDIRQMDADMAKRIQQGQNLIYQRISKLPALTDPADAAYYESCYQAWAAGSRECIAAKTLKDNEVYRRLLGSGMKKISELYFSDQPQTNPSMEKNLTVKMLFWHDALLTGVVERWNAHTTGKLVLENAVKRQEYLFAYLLTLLGYDVLLLQSEADISGQEEAWGLSQKVRLGDFQKVPLPAFDRAAVLASIADSASGRNRPEPAGTLAAGAGPAVFRLPPRPGSKKKTAAASVLPSDTSNPVVVKIPSRPGSAEKKEAVPSAPRPVSAARPSASRSGASSSGGQRAEKSFEELALLASSVVQIAIHGQNRDVIGTGSGIMIGRDGYILTNNHVASGGRFYSVRIEDDETVYSTDELIKYHSTLDLAILRIDRRLNPLPVYRGEKPLVRGQKVVAIGSPLGLFNSVSDGIISGFRVIDGVDMIQFTAPISRGSSGGAVLNMYGEVIGMSTAGIDSGQNINLAMGYECISRFISGFV